MIVAAERSTTTMWKRLVRAAIALTALQFAGSTLASPYTVYFSGTTTAFYDSTGASVSGNVGQSFSGWLTFDLANAETLDNYDSSDFAYSTAYSDRGCYTLVNGVCTLDYGAIPPLVTGYAVNSPFAPPGGYQPIPTSAYVYDYSTVQNFRAYPPANPPTGYDQYNVSRNQFQESYTGDLVGAYQHSSIEHYFSLFPLAYDNSMFGLVSDLLATPNLANVPLGQSNLDFESQGLREDCLFSEGCTFNGYLPESQHWQGTLTSLRVAPGGANVPEPMTLVLVGVALAGLGFSRRKKGG
jgi:hypothetical protein